MLRSPPFSNAKSVKPPIVEKRPVKIRQHGDTRIDEYAWLKDEDWQDVLREPSKLRSDIRSVLEAENAYYENITGDLEGLRKSLFSEMRGRIKEDDSSVPAPDGDWAYWVEFREGGEYPVFKRKPRGGGPEQTLFDGDKERDGAEFFSIGDIAHSPDHRLVAYATDRVGSEYFEIRVREIETGREFEETITSADGASIVWAKDSGSFFYIERDDKQRAKWIKHHVLGDAPEEDTIVYEEEDDAFFLSVSKSQSGEFIFLGAGNHTTSEVWFLRTDAPTAPPKIIEKRTEGVEYSVDHHGDDFYILTNEGGAVDFKIVKTPIDAPGRANWRDWLKHRDAVYLVSKVCLGSHLVRLERRNALPAIIISTYDGDEYEVGFEEAAYSLGLSVGYEFETDTVRFTYESPSTPRQTFDFNLDTHERRLLKTQEVPSGHDSSLYVVERIEAAAKDGVRIPVTILRLKDSKKNRPSPLLLYGYGSYGHTIPAGFSTGVLSLVNRGVTYAIAHPRGGAARGRQWYLDGKLDKKMNTFTDFVCAAETLIKRKYTAKRKIVIYGGSAGGLLVGAAVNLRPELFAGVLGAVPFVDVVNTISDADLPLTPPEWNEWGNPIEDKKAYRAIKAYSPYDNIKLKNYPAIMATGGLTDYRVTYWEPAKWIARLRDKARGGPFVLRMNMGAGHAGAAARFERIDENAHLYAFALKALGMENVQPVESKE